LDLNVIYVISGLVQDIELARNADNECGLRQPFERPILKQEAVRIRCVRDIELNRAEAPDRIEEAVERRRGLTFGTELD